MPDSIPKGLVLFARPLTPRQRRRRWMLLTLVMLATVALVWPGYALVADVFPLVFGLPLNLAWIVGWLLLVMGGLFALYRADHGVSAGHGVSADAMADATADAEG